MPPSNLEVKRFTDVSKLRHCDSGWTPSRRPASIGVPAAIAELDRAVNQLGLAGAMIDDKVNGHTYDEPEFLPLWQAAEQMGVEPTQPDAGRKRGHSV